MPKWTEEQKEKARIKREEKKRQQHVEAEIERLKYLLDRTLEHAQQKAKYRNKPVPEHRILKIGDKARLGNRLNCVVKDVIEDGKVVLLQDLDAPFDTAKRPDKTYPIMKRDESWHFWAEVNNKNLDKDAPKLSHRKGFRITNMNRELRSFIHSLSYFGYNDNPDYQRDLVWSLEDKQALIHSILHEVSIGTIAIIKNDYPIDDEILDGKQRVNALMDFFEDRFKYKGLYYSQLNFEDRIMINSSAITVIETESLTEEQKLEYFLSLNAGGRLQSQDHLDKVEQMLQEMKNEEK